MRRVWCMPSHETFTVRPIRELLEFYSRGRPASVDPFARNSKIATLTNDIDPDTSAEYHLDAVEFLRGLASDSADLVVVDPPYSSRQLSESYKKVAGSFDGRNARFYRQVFSEAARVLRPGALGISFGWNTNGFGKRLGFRRIETLIVAHGSAHNDTLVSVEEKQ